MDSDILNKTDELIELIKQSREYHRYLDARQRAYADESTGVLLNEYARLQYKLQAASVSGSADEEELIKLQKMGEFLQFNREASEYLLAQYALNGLLTEIFSRLGHAVDIDLSMLEA